MAIGRTLLALVLTVSAVSIARAHGDPAPVAEGEACTTSGGLLSRPVPCETGLTCVLTSFGNPAVDLPTSGTCRSLLNPPPMCSITFCGTNGSEAVCTITDETATCGAWARRSDTGGMRPNCNVLCTRECRIPMLVASDGSTHCTACVLHAFSCTTGFSVYGPVAPSSDKCGAPIDPFDAFECCEKFNKGCRRKGQLCSTGGSLIQPPGCEKGTKCILTDFGFPAVDKPTTGRCRVPARRVRKCSVRYCSKRGRKAVCKIGNVCATCFAWAKRMDGGPRPRCDFACPEFCLIGSARPRGSDRKAYCSRCALMSRSCETRFKVYGPIKK